ncbi:FtsX-like permease family protein [Candidatus Uhrbacteria bacterium]|nr:FtsX-like permease family protein [Candidatus Uhrbacteria bacterium]
MKISDLFNSAYESLLRTRNRSLLTMLGMIIGIAAVILALSIGESAEKYILDQISGFGSDVLYMESGSLEEQTSNPSPFVEQVLTLDDFKALRREPWVEAVSGTILKTDLLQHEGKNQNIQISGVTTDDLIINDYSLSSGVYFSRDQIDGRARVAVLGTTIEENFYGQGNAVGQRVKLGNANYRIIGVLDKIGSRFFQNMDEMVYIPATTLMQQYNYDTFQFMSVKTSLPIEEAKFRLQTKMRELHNIDPGDDDDFLVSTAEEAAEIVSSITGVLQILLSAIAAISLLVGGIGIMNIMYVSVTERTQEVGLRKAVGATNTQVLNQFLAEAVMLTLGGGVGGVLLGSGAAWLAIQIINNYVAGWSFMVSTDGIIFGVIVSTAVGLIFGYAPAKSASKLDPIVALRKNE